MALGSDGFPHWKTSCDTCDVLKPEILDETILRWQFQQISEEFELLFYFLFVHPEYPTKVHQSFFHREFPN